MESLLALGLLGLLAAVGWSLTDRGRARPAPRGRSPQRLVPGGDPEADPDAGTGSGTASAPSVDAQAGTGVAPPSMVVWGQALAPQCQRAQIPLPYALQWLAIESGGNPCTVGDPRAHGPDGNPREVGVAQFYNPDDLIRLRVTGTQLRAYCVPGDQHTVVYRGRAVRGFSQALSRPLTPAEVAQQAEMTVDLIQRCRTTATADLTAVHAGPTWSPDRRDFWALVKLQHGLPGISRAGLPAVTRKLGRPPKDWKEFADTLSSVTLDPETEKYRAQFPTILDNAERCARAVPELRVA